jgi:hypothetical protein
LISYIRKRTHTSVCKLAQVRSIDSSSRSMASFPSDLQWGAAARVPVQSMPSVKLWVRGRGGPGGQGIWVRRPCTWSQLGLQEDIRHYRPSPPAQGHEGTYRVVGDDEGGLLVELETGVTWVAQTMQRESTVTPGASSSSAAESECAEGCSWCPEPSCCKVGRHTVHACTKCLEIILKPDANDSQ